MVKSEKQGKIGDCGVTMMFIGYSNNHDGDCYRVFNPKTNGVSKTCDVIWLKRICYEKQDTKITKHEPIVTLYVGRIQEDGESKNKTDEESLLVERRSSNSSMKSIWSHHDFCNIV